MFLQLFGNAVSNELTITITSSANVDKTVTSLTANFGENGKAVKMLRYLDANGKWVVLKANNGEITFSDLVLKPGVNTVKTYFVLKPQVGVANGSALSFSFASLNDGAGGQVPTSGKLPKSLNVGLVNSDTQATVITSEWIGYMSQSITVLSPTSYTIGGVYYVGNLIIKGPSNARFHSIKLRNPYMGVKFLVWNNSEWVINFFGPDYKILAADVNWNSDYVTLKNLPPTGNNLKVDTYNNESTPKSRQDI